LAMGKCSRLLTAFQAGEEVTSSTGRRSSISEKGFSSILGRFQICLIMPFSC
jgi:hypothetical protein